MQIDLDTDAIDKDTKGPAPAFHPHDSLKQNGEAGMEDPLADPISPNSHLQNFEVTEHGQYGDGKESETYEETQP
ncbi:hypothetical protein N7523_002872 [Penicillium sp. IBT 18751x]|nr:hypothetical protein N7523_002872 [Penicillium sp. IBT 18751x]